MSQTVCAIVVTYNQRERLAGCLDSLLAQTRPVDRILVIDNASTDGTRSLLDAQYPEVAKISLKEYAGGAGGLASGVRWAHCNKFDWIWTFDDGIEVRPGCLETMLSFAEEADLIQVGSEGDPPRAGAMQGALTATPTESCDFRAALIGKRVTELVGLPDERYFSAGYDTAYGYVASRKTKSICLNYAGIIRIARNTEIRNRAAFYLAVRNLFLNRDHLARNGVPPRPYAFFVQSLATFLRQLGEAASTPAHAVENAMAAVDGLRDGLYKRFDRLPRF